MASNDDNQSRKTGGFTVSGITDGSIRLADSKPDIEVFGEIVTNPDIKIHSSVWSWPEATPGARITAFVVDSCILGAITKLLDSVYARFLDQPMPGIISAVIGVLYFLIQHKISGQTLGKRFVGIRVLPLEHSASGVPFERLLLRETIGRTISLLTVYGYLRIFFKSDRMGFHDSLSRTRVASLGQERGSVSIQFRYVALGIAGLIACGGFALYYTITQTSYPLRQFAKRLEPMGIQIEGIDGNIAHGFTIAKITRDSEDVSFEVNDATFHYDLKTGEESELRVKDLIIKNARVIVRKWPQMSPKPGAPPVKKKEEEASGPFGATADGSKPMALPASLAIGTIDINDVEVQVPGRPAYHLKRLLITDSNYKAALKTLNVGQLWLDSDSLLLSLKEMTVQEKVLALNQPAYIELRPALYPEVLKAPIDLQVEGLFENYQPSKLSLTGFNKKVNLKYAGDNGELTIKELTPLHYFKTDLPIWNIDFRMAGDLKKFNVSQMSGSLGVRNVRFVLDSGLLTNVKGARKFFLTPRLQADWKNMLAGRDPGMVLSSSDKLFAREALADAYFSKPVSSLSAPERDTLEGDARFFTDSVDAGVAPKITPLVSRPVPVPQRLPTSMGRGRPGPPPGVPAKLPPFKGRARSR